MDWISVNDRLPEDGGRILVAVRSTDDEGMRQEIGVFFAIYKNHRFRLVHDVESAYEFDLLMFSGTSFESLWGTIYEITHWMPLPELPAEG